MQNERNVLSLLVASNRAAGPLCRLLSHPAIVGSND